MIAYLYMILIVLLYFFFLFSFKSTGHSSAKEPLLFICASGKINDVQSAVWSGCFLLHNLIEPNTSHLNHLSCVLLSNRVLLVERQESRPGEWLARKFFGALSAVGSTSMSIPIQMVGKAMVSNTLLQPEQKTEILENKDIASLGKSAGK